MAEPQWIDARDILAVNGYGQLSFNYGHWHGEAKYEWVNLIGGIWHMEFMTQGSRGEMTKHFYRQIRGSLIYLNQEEGEDSKYNSVLLPSPDSQIANWEVMREAQIDHERIQQYLANRDQVGL